MNENPKPENRSSSPLSFIDSLLLPQERELLFSTPKVEYVKRDIIAKQNARIAEIPIITSGLVKLSKEMRRDKNMIIRIVKPGCFLGLSSVFGSEMYEYSVLALENTTVKFVDIGILKQIMKENNAFCFEIIKQLGRDSVLNINRLASLLHKQLPGRVADILLYFAEEIYESHTFTIPLTRLELAELAGTTKESLIRTLSEFKHDKIIDTTRNHVSIKSMDIIKTLSRLG